MRLGLVLVLVLLSSFSRADAPLGVSYQGLALDASGAKLTGTAALGVRIWSDATSTDPGALVYEETHAGTPVQDGVFQIVIGQGGSPSGTFDESLFAAPDRWLELEVNGETMAPRQKLQSVAYALQCRAADIPDGSIGQEKISGHGGATIPRAYGHVGSSGALVNGTSNIASITTGPANRYFIAFTDFSFSTASNVAIVTPVVTVPGNAVFTDISSNGGRLVVQIRLNGAETFPGPFMFVVWD